MSSWDEGANRRSSKPRLLVLELFSGVGGMHYALNEAGVEAEVVAAMDISDVANRGKKETCLHSRFSISEHVRSTRMQCTSTTSRRRLTSRPTSAA